MPADFKRLVATTNHPQVCLRLFGQLGIHHEGRGLRLPCRRAAALLPYLSARSGYEQTREKIASIFWENSEPTRARNSLRQVIFALRKALGADGILTCNDDTVAVNPRTITSDLWEFERAIADGGEVALSRAVDLYSGDFLDGFNLPGFAFQTWLTIERERLRQAAIDAHSRLIAIYLEASASTSALRVAQRLLTIDPLDEATHRLVMRIYADQGRRSLAVRHFHSCRQMLRQELGIEPDGETRNLYADLCRSRPSVSPARVGRCSGPEHTERSFCRDAKMAPSSDDEAWIEARSS